MREKETLKVIGLAPDDVCSGITAGYYKVHPDMKAELLYGVRYEFPAHILLMLDKARNNKIDLKELCQLNFLIGECYAKAANELISEFKNPDFIANSEIKIFHYPYDEKIDNLSKKSILTVGESALIAKQTNCLTISNFAEADIAVGGQGAPLSAFAYEKWFRNSIILEISEASNVTVISDNNPTLGFESGCGSLMIDYCTQKLFQQKNDNNGHNQKKS